MTGPLRLVPRIARIVAMVVRHPRSFLLWMEVPLIPSRPTSPAGPATWDSARSRPTRLLRYVCRVARIVAATLRHPAKFIRWAALLHTSDERSAYVMLTEMQEASLTRMLPGMSRHAATMPHQPRFLIVVEPGDDAATQSTLRSIANQIWAGRTQVTAAWSLPSDLPLDADYVIFARAGDTLAPDALYQFATVLNANPDLDLVYADHDLVDDHGTRHSPFYKPDWSPDYLESLNYISHAACFRLSAARLHLGADSLYDFILRFTEAGQRTQHLPSVLYHRMDVSPLQADIDIAALRGRLRRSGRTGNVIQGRMAMGYYDIVLQTNSRPLVSIVMPTAGKVVPINDQSVDLVMNCINSIRDKSTYRDIEMVLVDNGDLGEARIAALTALGCRFVTYTAPTFNVARKLNLGASIARGDILLLMNDDMEIIAPDWIERMLDHFSKSHVGVVGAKLLYPDGAIQHVGVAGNHGSPDHVRQGRPRDDTGYVFSSCAVRNFFAVTGACMMTPRALFNRVGGYTEALAISFNDVDYCLKVRELGFTVLCAPRAELVHFESRSRKAELDPAELVYFHRRWGHWLAADPYYNELRLTTNPASFDLRHDPVV